MNLLQKFLIGIVKVGTFLALRMDTPGLERVPSIGPLILAVNHINTLDVPILDARLFPRRLIALAKIETWDNPFMGWLFTLFEAIPVHRGQPDLKAIHLCLDELDQGGILAVAPEGTRSYDGQLQPGQPGIVLLALRSGAPILPVVHWGGEAFSTNIHRLKRTDFHIRVGRPFTLDPHGERVNNTVRQAMTDEIMGQMAALMPVPYRGAYRDAASRPPHYLNFA